MRTIMHVDMDAFFASVETLDHPEYAGQPVIVGARRHSRRGVVSAASYEARQFGVHSAMPVSKAVLLCPHGIFLPTRIHRYQEISAQIQALFPQFSPTVEPLSIDEAFLDMTGSEHFYSSLEAMGNALKTEILNKTGLTASVGIAPNKFLAKLASDWRKPDGLFIIRPGEVQPFLNGLPVSKIWGVGKKTKLKLNELNIYDVRDLLSRSQPWLQKQLGPSLGTHLFYLARGIDERPVKPQEQAKSIGHEVTFSEDQKNPDFLRSQLAQMAEKVGWRLRQQRLYARTVAIKVRFFDFRTITRSQTTTAPFNDDDTIFSQALHLLQKVKMEPVRLLGVSVSNLSAGSQLSLFAAEDQGSSKVNEVMDRINQRFSPGTITKGRTLPADPE